MIPTSQISDTNVNIVHACQPNCGACCIAPSISSAIPGMPDGKPAGIRCIQLSEDNLCQIFGRGDRPAVCSDFKPCPSICRNDSVESLRILTELEQMTL